jgi:hypothetical protein
MMKTKIFFFILCGIITLPAVNGQQQWNLIDLSSKWNIICGGCITQETHIFKFAGSDTLISGEPYRKILKSEDPFESTWEYSNYMIREDEDTRKVYLRSEVGGEGLIYDFGAAVGDTIEIYNAVHQLDVFMLVTDIDSVLINGQYRKRITLQPDYWPFQDVWVEGIGTLNQGLHFAGIYLTGPTYLLLCYKYNDEVVFMQSGYTACIYPYVSIDETLAESPQTMIYYDPGIRAIRLNTPPSADQYTLELYTVTGQKALSKPVLYNEPVYTAGYGIREGLYVYRLFMGNSVLSGKVVIR